MTMVMILTTNDNDEILFPLGALRQALSIFRGTCLTSYVIQFRPGDKNAEDMTKNSRIIRTVWMISGVVRGLFGSRLGVV